MTAISASRAPRASRYGFGQAARMEWIKLRSQRYPKWLLPVTAAGMIAVAVIAGRNTSAHLSAAQCRLRPHQQRARRAGLRPAVIGVLGVLVMTSEYSSGLIRATLAAVPDRRLVLAAKVAVFSAAALVARADPDLRRVLRPAGRAARFGCRTPHSASRACSGGPHGRPVSLAWPG